MAASRLQDICFNEMHIRSECCSWFIIFLNFMLVATSHPSAKLKCLWINILACPLWLMLCFLTCSCLLFLCYTIHYWIWAADQWWVPSFDTLRVTHSEQSWNRGRSKPYQARKVIVIASCQASTIVNILVVRLRAASISIVSSKYVLTVQRYSS